MTTISIRPVQIYNTQNRKRSVSRPISNKEPQELKKLREKVIKYENSHKKLKMLIKWNIRSTQSSLKDALDILDTLEELYGDDAFEDI
jgi:hypothetical protein